MARSSAVSLASFLIDRVASAATRSPDADLVDARQPVQHLAQPGVGGGDIGHLELPAARRLALDRLNPHDPDVTAGRRSLA